MEKGVGAMPLERPEVMEKLRNLLCSSLGIDQDQIFMEADLRTEFSFDSTDALDMMFKIEKEFDIKQPKTKEDKAVWFENCKTVHDLYSYIVANLPQQPASSGT